MERVGELILAKTFVAVTCPLCGTSYSPDESSVLQFQFGESLCAQGGRGLLCPQRHGLYVICEWNT